MAAWATGNQPFFVQFDNRVGRTPVDIPCPDKVEETGAFEHLQYVRLQRGENDFTTACMVFFDDLMEGLNAHCIDQGHAAHTDDDRVIIAGGFKRFEHRGDTTKKERTGQVVDVNAGARCSNRRTLPLQLLWIDRRTGHYRTGGRLAEIDYCRDRNSDQDRLREIKRSSRQHRDEEADKRVAETCIDEEVNALPLIHAPCSHQKDTAERSKGNVAQNRP